MPRLLPLTFEDSSTRRSPQSSTYGFTLTELAVILGIVGLVLAGIWSAASAAYEAQRVRHAEQQLIAIAANIKNYGRLLNQTGSPLDITQTVCQLGAVPPDMLIASENCPDNPTISSPWGSSMSFVAPNAVSVKISYNSLPAEACVDLLMAVAGSGSNELLSVSAGATGTSPGGNISTAAPLSIPVTLSAATVACPSTSNFNGDTMNGFPVTYDGTVLSFTFSTFD